MDFGIEVGVVGEAHAGVCVCVFGIGGRGGRLRMGVLACELVLLQRSAFAGGGGRFGGVGGHGDGDGAVMEVAGVEEAEWG